MSDHGKDMWIRHVLVPELTDDEEGLQALADFITNFSVVKDSSPNAETQAVLNDVNNGENLVGPFSSVSELMEDLNADD